MTPSRLESPRDRSARSTTDPGPGAAPPLPELQQSPQPLSLPAAQEPESLQLSAPATAPAFPGAEALYGEEPPETVRDAEPEPDTGGYWDAAMWRLEALRDPFAPAPGSGPLPMPPGLQPMEEIPASYTPQQRAMTEAVWKGARQRLFALPPAAGRGPAGLMALDWPRYLETLSPAQREATDALLKDRPDQAAARRRLTNIKWIAERSGVSTADVAAHYEIARAGFARGSNWGDAAAGDDQAFSREVVRQATGDAHAHRLSWGLDGDGDTEVATREQSAANQGYLSAVSPKDENAFEYWLKSVPLFEDRREYFDPARTGDYFDAYETGRLMGEADLKAARTAAHKILTLVMTNDTHFQLDSAVPHVRRLTPQQWQLMERELVAMSKKGGELEGLLNKMGLAFARGGKNIIDGISRDLQRRSYDQTWNAGDEVPEEYLKYGPKYLVDRKALPFFGWFTGDDVTLTAEQARQANLHAKSRRDDLHTEWRLRQLADAEVNEIKRNNLIERGLIGSAEAIPFFIAASNPAGLVPLYMSFHSEAQDMLQERGFSEDQAKDLAVVVGGAQALLSRLSIPFLTKAPGVNRLLGKLANGSLGRAVTSGAGRYLGRVVVGAAETSVNMALQNVVLPEVVIRIASEYNTNVPGRTWEEINNEFWSATADAGMSFWPLVFLGSGFAHSRDVRGADALVRDPGKMFALGFSPEHVTAVRNARPGEAVSVLRGIWHERVPILRGDSRAASMAEAAGLTWHSMEDTRATTAARLLDAAELPEASGPPTLRYTEHGDAGFAMEPAADMAATATATTGGADGTPLFAPNTDGTYTATFPSSESAGAWARAHQDRIPFLLLHSSERGHFLTVSPHAPAAPENASAPAAPGPDTSAPAAPHGADAPAETNPTPLTSSAAEPSPPRSTPGKPNPEDAAETRQGGTPSEDSKPRQTTPAQTGPAETKPAATRPAQQSPPDTKSPEEPSPGKKSAESNPKPGPGEAPAADPAPPAPGTYARARHDELARRRDAAARGISLRLRDGIWHLRLPDGTSLPTGTDPSVGLILRDRILDRPPPPGPPAAPAKDPSYGASDRIITRAEQPPLAPGAEMDTHPAHVPSTGVPDLVTRAPRNIALTDFGDARDFRRGGDRRLAESRERIKDAFGAENMDRPGAHGIEVQAAHNGQLRLVTGEHFLDWLWHDSGGNASLANARLGMYLHEEVTHAATLSVLRDDWLAAGKPYHFPDWVQDRSHAILQDVAAATGALDPAGQKQARENLHASFEAYFGQHRHVTPENIVEHLTDRVELGKTTGGPARFLLEMVRQVVQMRRYSQTSETVFVRALNRLTDFGKAILAKLGSLTASVTGTPAGGHFGPLLADLVRRTRAALKNGSPPFTPAGKPRWAEGFRAQGPENNPTQDSTPGSGERAASSDPRQLSVPDTPQTITRRSVDDKLARYLLNREHERGKEKAAWFELALGFTRENADALAEQLVFDPKTAKQTAVTEFGTKYNQIISVKGPNGRTLPVKAAWIRLKNGDITLVSAVPGD